MATEGPLVHDGGNCVAASDLSGTTSTLSGQSGSGQFLAVGITSGGRAVGLATSGGVAYGILQNKPMSGQAADIGIMGVSKVMAGGTIVAGNLLQVGTSGTVISATSGSVIGQAIEGSASGGIFTAEVLPAL
jgi:hypothetical protein